MPRSARPTSARPAPWRPCDPSHVNACAGADPPGPDLELLIEGLDRLGPASSAAAFVAQATATTWSITAGPALEELIGWSAPPDCDALGIVAAGSSVRAVPLPADGDSLRSKPPEDLWRAGEAQAHPAQHDTDVRPILEGRASPPVRVIVAVDRFGRSASRLAVGPAVSCEPPRSGRMLDTLLRCLGRPTPPPAEGTAGLLALLWFAAIIEKGRSGAQRLTWTDTVKLHPASQLLLGSGAHFSHRELAATADRAASTLTWEVLKEAAVWRDNLSELCPGPLAAWMDAGMYSRWVLSQLPDLDALYPSVVDVLRPSTARHVVDHVARSLRGGLKRDPGPPAAP